jgi:uncharacterized protein
MTRIASDEGIKQVLTTAKVIAVVGHSDKPERTSYRVAAYLREAGYTVYPVNPTVAEIDGHKSYATLDTIPAQIDVVDVFRRAEHLQDVVDAAIVVGAKVVWAQLGVVDETAAQKADAAGLDVVMDHCMMAEHRRLLGR